MIEGAMRDGGTAVYFALPIGLCSRLAKVIAMGALVAAAERGPAVLDAELLELLRLLTSAAAAQAASRRALN
jgi:hypothetical protein